MVGLLQTAELLSERGSALLCTPLSGDPSCLPLAPSFLPSCDSTDTGTLLKRLKFSYFRHVGHAVTVTTSGPQSSHRQTCARDTGEGSSGGVGLGRQFATPGPEGKAGRCSFRKMGTRCPLVSTEDTKGATGRVGLCQRAI